MGKICGKKTKHNMNKYRSVFNEDVTQWPKAHHIYLFIYLYFFTTLLITSLSKFIAYSQWINAYMIPKNEWPMKEKFDVKFFVFLVDKQIEEGKYAYI